MATLDNVPFTKFSLSVCNGLRGLNTAVPNSLSEIPWNERSLCEIALAAWRFMLLSNIYSIRDCYEAKLLPERRTYLRFTTGSTACLYHLLIRSRDYCNTDEYDLLRQGAYSQYNCITIGPLFFFCFCSL
jgi:hypothetical protein